jgi:hypothetical protein
MEIEFIPPLSRPYNKIEEGDTNRVWQIQGPPAICPHPASRQNNSLPTGLVSVGFLS